jgi:Ca-activated chloride channel homolog
MSNMKIRTLSRAFLTIVLIGLIITLSQCSNPRVTRQIDDLSDIPSPRKQQPEISDETVFENVDAKTAHQHLLFEAPLEEFIMMDFEVDEMIYRTEHNTDEYNIIVENDFKKSWDNPLSTFSIDVDKASFAQIRSYLNYHQLPPKDAVRIEELINYFSYNYPQPTDQHPFSVTAEIGACPWNADHKLVHIGIQGKSLNFDELHQGNYVFLIDVSGSMDMPDRLPLVKKSLNIMLDNLHPDDKIAIVVYAGAAGLVLPSTSITEKDIIKKAINNLSAGGSTAGGQGIRLAYQVAKENFIPNGNNRIILATDGDFNVGVSSTSELVRMVEEKRKEGIYLTICGYGMGNYKDGRLEQISAAGNGVYFYIDNLREAERVFSRELRANLFTIAKDVKIQVEFNPLKVKSYRLVGYENRLMAREDFEDDEKDAGELGAGHSVTALYEIIPTIDEDISVSNLRYQNSNSTEKAKTEEWLTLKLRYKPISEDKSVLIEKQVEYKEDVVSPAKRLAETVAGFGMLLRDSKYKGDLSYDTILKTLKQLDHIDEQDKWELVKLVETANLLSQNK